MHKYNKKRVIPSSWHKSILVWGVYYSPSWIQDVLSRGYEEELYPGIGQKAGRISKISAFNLIFGSEYRIDQKPRKLANLEAQTKILWINHCKIKRDLNLNLRFPNDSG